jgi:hypothetical protein
MYDACRSARACIASQGACRIERCTCGTVHLTFGALTLRLNQDAFESLAALLDEAVRFLRVEATSPTAEDDDPFEEKDRNHDWS